MTAGCCRGWVQGGTFSTSSQMQKDTLFQTPDAAVRWSASPQYANKPGGLLCSLFTSLHMHIPMHPTHDSYYHAPKCYNDLLPAG